MLIVDPALPTVAIENKQLEQRQTNKRSIVQLKSWRVGFAIVTTALPSLVVTVWYWLTRLPWKLAIKQLSLYCALASCGAVYCNLSCLWVCVFATGGRAVSEPYYSQRARSVCVSLRAFSLLMLLLLRLRNK